MCFNVQFTLLPHQQDAFDCVIEELQNGNNRVLFSMCTGSGKTRVILKIPGEMEWERVIYIFPTLSLVNQMKEDYIKKCEISGVIFVCSLKEKNKDILVDTHEYITDDKDLTNKLKSNNYTIVTTYASLEKVLKCVKKNKQDCNLIFDEAHHESADNCQEILKNYSEQIDNQVLATATFDEKEQDEVCFNYSYSDAVDDGNCRDFDIYVNLRKKGQERDLVKDLQEIQRKTGNSKCMIFTQYSNDNDKENKNNVKQFFKKHEPIIKKHNGWIKQITAETKIEERSNILNEFDKNSNEKLSLLVSCKTIGEGVDTKNANMVLFADSTKSTKDIIQKIGRAVRIYRDENGNKKKEQPPGSIVVFVYVDENDYKNCITKEQCDEVIRKAMHENGDFSTVFNVMVALKQNDPEMYRRCICYPNMPCDKKQESKEKDKQERTNNINENEEKYNEDDESKDDEESKDNEEYNNKITNEDKDDEDEDENVQSDVDNKDKEVNIKNKNTKQKRKLHFDVPDDLKITFKLDKSTDLDFDFTSKIDFEIESDGKSLVDIWYENLEKVKMFINDNKKTPSQTSKNKDEKQLGGWLSHQKKNYKKQKEAMSLNEPRRSVFEQFQEEYKEYFLTNIDIWHDKLDKVKYFIIENNKRPNQYSSNVDEKILGQWLRSQIKNYKKQKQAMSLNDPRRNIFEEFLDEYKEYILSLNEIWYDNLEKLKKFINENKKTPSSETQIGAWLSGTIIKHKQQKEAMILNDPRRKVFEEFLDEYKEYILSNDDIWYNNLNKFKQFIDENKKVPMRNSINLDEKQLSRWLDTNKGYLKGQGRRSFHINDPRTKVFEEFLDEYKEYLLTVDNIWYNNLNKLKQFIDENKKIPSQHSKQPDIKHLGVWLVNQKINYKNQKRSIIINDQRRIIFENFITEYKQYFQNFELNIIETQDKKEKPLNEKEQTTVENHIDIDKYTLTKLKQLAKEYKVPNYTKYKSENKDELIKLLKDKINNIPENTQQGFGMNIPQQLPNESQTTFDIVKPGLTPLQNMLQFEENKEKEQDEKEDEENYENNINIKQKNMHTFKPKQINKDKQTINDNNTQPILSRMSELHKKYKTMKSSNLSKHFTEDNGKYWREYHDLVKQNEQTYQQDKIPVNQVIQYLETKKNKRIKKVADLGCGLARIYKHFQNKNHKFTFVNIDHYVPEDQINYCLQGNIKNTELEDEDIDYTVLCLALWGSDYKEYLTEIHRILDIQGELIIVEPSSRWIKEDEQTGERTNELKLLLEKNHFKIKQIQDKEKFMFIVCEKL